MRITYGPNIGTAELALPAAAPAAVPSTRSATWKTVDHQFVADSYADMQLTQLVPRFMPYGSKGAANVKLISVIETIPNPRSISTSQHPIVLDIILQAQRFNPGMGYDFYLRGVGATALIIADQFYEPIRSMLVPISELISGTDPQYPAIDQEFAASIDRCERVIFTNGQHTSWKGLLAFMQGAFWLLGFIDRPQRRRGSYSPLEYVDNLVKHYGERAYIPL